MRDVFVDANVALYASGREHPSRQPCQDVMRALAEFGNGVTSAEMLQEVLHVCLRRNDLGRARTAIGELDVVLAGRIEPVLRIDVLRAAEYDFDRKLDSRDRIHLAVMERIGLTGIISTDHSFDGIPGVTRLDPLTFHSWRDSVFGESP